VPQSAELYCRASQLPDGVSFQTKDQLLLDLVRTVNIR
jgi:hypothetical protein